MTTHSDSVLVTGATGLVGSHTLVRLLDTLPGAHFFVLTRDLELWRTRAREFGVPTRRVTPLEGDITQPGLGLGRVVRRALQNRIRIVVHAAADTVFSRPLDEARVVNTDGTANVLDLAQDWRSLTRYVQISTAFVAGRRCGTVLERDNGTDWGFVNGYEQSKFEAERLVRGSSLPWAIVRPSAIVCDGADGHVSQFNAVHRALRLYHNGLASMMPGDDSNPVDIVSVDYVADCIAVVATAPRVELRTFHACAGSGAIRLGDLLDEAYAVWSEAPSWKRRAIPRPALTDLDTYRLFERAVEQTGDSRLVAITRSLSHFVPQLGMPKDFDTSEMEMVTGRAPPSAAGFWPSMIRYLIRSQWAVEARRAA